MQLFESVRDQLEGFAKPLLQRRMQLLVDGLAHLFELCRVIRLDRRQSRFNRQPQSFDARIEALCQPGQVVPKGFKLLRLQRTQLTDLPCQCLAKALQRL